MGYFRLGINPDTDSGFLGFVIIDGKERGKGCGEQMLRLAVRYAFEIAGLHSVALNVFDCNRAAEGLYRKLGFREAERTPECFAFQEENGEESGWSLLWQKYKCKIIVILRQGGEAPNAGSLRLGGINGSEQYCGFRKRILPGD